MKVSILAVTYEFTESKVSLLFSNEKRAFSFSPKFSLTDWGDLDDSSVWFLDPNLFLFGVAEFFG